MRQAKGLTSGTGTMTNSNTPNKNAGTCPSPRYYSFSECRNASPANAPVTFP